MNCGYEIKWSYGSAPKYDSVECLVKVNENDLIQEAIVDVNRPAICRLKQSCNGTV